MDAQIVQIVYTNYRGETSERRILPKELRFTATEYHANPQWILFAYDLDKEAERGFACADIKSWQPAPNPTQL